MFCVCVHSYAADAVIIQANVSQKHELPPPLFSSGTARDWLKANVQSDPFLYLDEDQLYFKAGLIKPNFLAWAARQELIRKEAKAAGAAACAMQPVGM
jgi:hypothetical protein